MGLSALLQIEVARSPERTIEGSAARLLQATMRAIGDEPDSAETVVDQILQARALIRCLRLRRDRVSQQHRFAFFAGAGDLQDSHIPDLAILSHILGVGLEPQARISAAATLKDY